MKFLITFSCLLHISYSYLLENNPEINSSNTIKTRNVLDKVSDERAFWYEHQDDIIRTKYFKQPLHHYNDLVKDTWNMTVLQSSVFWRESKSLSIIYLFVGGYAVGGTTSLLTEGLMYELANDTGGVMFAPQHRFYGDTVMKSHIRYLSSEQAIADYKRLLISIKNDKHYKNAKVVLIGGGYSAVIAVRLKSLFPDIADVVIASGAALEAKTEYHEYLHQVIRNFNEKTSCACMKLINDRFAYFQRSFDKNEVSDLIVHSNICKHVDMRKKTNQGLFIMSQINFLADAAETSVRAMYKTCKRLSIFNNTVTGASGFWDSKKKCFDYNYEDYVYSMGRAERVNIHAKWWLYQCCTEFGLFPTTSTLPEPFTNMIPLQFYEKLCTDFFDPEFTVTYINRAVERSNELYGGRKPKAKNVIYVYGEMDPWRHVGARDRIFDENYFLLIPGVSHNREFMPISKFSKTESNIRVAKAAITRWMKKMLKITERNETLVKDEDEPLFQYSFKL